MECAEILTYFKLKCGQYLLIIFIKLLPLMSSAFHISFKPATNEMIIMTATQPAERQVIQRRYFLQQCTDSFLFSITPSLATTCEVNEGLILLHLSLLWLTAVSNTFIELFVSNTVGYLFSPPDFWGDSTTFIYLFSSSGFSRR